MAKNKDFFVKLKAKIQNANYLHYFAFSLVLVSLLFAIFKYDFAYQRIWQNLIDFFSSVKYYFKAVILSQEGLEIEISSINDVDINRVFGFDIEALIRKFDFFWLYFWSYENFSEYCIFVLDKTVVFLSIACLLIPAFILSVMILKKIYLMPGEDESRYEETKQLSFFKIKILPVLRLIFNWFVGFKDFLLSHSIYIKLLLFIWLANINLISILFGVLAFYFYFVASFEFSILKDIFLKLGIDLITMLFSVSLIVWFVILYIFICKALKSLAYSILNHHEMKNRGFINAQPLGTLGCATMGAGKTSLSVDMALSTSAMFKDKALEILIKTDMKFPNFPWLRFEDDLKNSYNNHIVRQAELKENGKSDIPIDSTIYNLASSKYWVISKAQEFSENPCSDNLWGYDYEKYKLEFDDDLKITELFEALITYSKAYLIYITQSSLIFGNLSIREDMYCDNGYLPLWNTDFFHRSPADSESTSRFAKIIDFDMLRLGKKMCEENQNSGAFEFGVVVLTEIGKERGNAKENREMKKKDEEANPNNDGFEDTVKMIRHRATVDFFPFVRIISDEQRAESLGANTRDTFSVIQIVDKSELKVLYKGLFFDGFIHDILYPKFESFYLQMRNLRCDNTLLVYLLKNFFSWTENRYTKLENRFGYYTLNFETTTGRLDNVPTETKYYLSRKKTFSNRFATDCYGDFFEKMSLYSGLGLEDFLSYQNVQQTDDEMQLQNSYFYIKMSYYTQFADT